MAWVESRSRSFRARRDGAQSAKAERLLAELYRTRLRLAEYSPRSLDAFTG